MNASYFSRDVLEFFRVLAKHEVHYVLIGGAAVIYHGYARLTGDVDFLYDHRADNVRRLWLALLEFWGGSVPAVAGPEELEDPNLVVQFGRPPNRIDLIASLRSVSFPALWRDRVQETIDVDGETVPVSIISLACLRKAKQEAGRPKDLDDLGHLPPG